MREGRIIGFLTLSLIAIVARSNDLLQEAQKDDYNVEQTLEILAKVELQDLSKSEKGLFYYLKGWCLEKQQKYSMALHNYYQSFEWYSKIWFKSDEENGWLTDILNNISIIYQKAGDYDNAILYQERSLTFLKKLPRSRSQWRDFNLNYNLGYNYGEKGDVENSLDFLGKAIRNCRNSGDSVRVFNMIGYVLGRNENIKLSNMYLDSAISMNADSDYARQFKGIAMKNLAKNYGAVGDFEKSEKYYTESIPFLNDYDRFYVYFELGEQKYSLKDFDQAIHYFGLARNTPAEEISYRRVDTFSYLDELAGGYSKMVREELSKVENKNNELKTIAESYALLILRDQWYNKDENKPIIMMLVASTTILALFGLFYFFRTRYIKNRVQRSLREIVEISDLD